MKILMLLLLAAAPAGAQWGAAEGANAANLVSARAETSVIGGAPLLVKVMLGHTSIKVDELLNLAPGDILQLDKPASGEMVIQIEGKNKYAGLVGQFKGKRAVRIKRSLKTGERVI